MSVGTISLVGISVVFLSFLVLYIIFRLLEFFFGDKNEGKTTLKKVEKNDVEDDTELVAVISAAMVAYSDKPVKILSITENKGNKSNWINHRSKIWRPVRKGVKRTW
jgi:Na+-transporting methylmalonyl-CoA/oxaloacetate decarboxylase gamma subunit